MFFRVLCQSSSTPLEIASSLSFRINWFSLSASQTCISMSSIIAYTLLFGNFFLQLSMKNCRESHFTRPYLSFTITYSPGCGSIFFISVQMSFTSACRRRFFNSSCIAEYSLFLIYIKSAFLVRAIGTTCFVPAVCVTVRHTFGFIVFWSDNAQNGVLFIRAGRHVTHLYFNRFCDFSTIPSQEHCNSSFRYARTSAVYKKYSDDFLNTV